MTFSLVLIFILVGTAAVVDVKVIKVIFSSYLHLFSEITTTPAGASLYVRPGSKYM